MKNNQVFRTNFLICVILIIGFTMTAVFSYQANYQASLNHIEQVASLTAEGIYYQLTAMFTKPVNISLTMAHDSLLMEHLSEEPENPEDGDFAQITRNYLKTYQDKYGFDSVFLVSSSTNWYYNFNGMDRVLESGEEENAWYYDLLDSNLEYSMNVDNDEVKGADNAITVFVNCKVFGPDQEVLGIVGVGIRIESIRELLENYEKKYQLKASLIGREGTIQISTDYTGYEKTDWFAVSNQQSLRGDVLGWEKDDVNLELWSRGNGPDKSFVVTRYIPELTWHLVVEQDTGLIVREMKTRLYQICVLIVIVILVVLFAVTNLVRHFKKQITELMEERQDLFKEATEQLYDNIYELNVTKNCYVGKRTEQYFESLGVKGIPYDKGLHIIAEKQIEEKFREGYIAKFSPENVIREYEKGNNHLCYDFRITQDGTEYYWMRIDAHVFYSAEDNSIHMFIYRKNIDAEKKRELDAATDEMTGFFTKTVTERMIVAQMQEHPERQYAFFIFDIDNFKQVNDRCGHVFGDYCIREFTRMIRKHFREQDILGRIGGDEFAAFFALPDAQAVFSKAAELSDALKFTCTNGTAEWKVSASIGVAAAPRDGADFDSLYRKADIALYETKRRGKNGFTVYGFETGWNEK